ncbi:MAG TPA: response regulator [Desulfomonilaceae bacterium]|nr:response regulator [Desulfomonilaceae bacterium]
MDTKKFFRKLFRTRKEPEPGIRSILVVDDDAGLVDNLKDILEGEGYEVFCAQSSGEASQVMREHSPWMALVDLKLPDGSGTALLSDLKKVKPDCVCILMTAYADVDSAILALEKGAFYYLQKPVRPAELVELVELAFETIRLKEEKRQTEVELRERNKELEQIIARLRNIIE